MGTTRDTLIQAAADFFQLGRVVVLGPTALGNANESYFVRAEDGQEYVLRFLRDQTLAGLKNERAIQEQLMAAGIPTSTMLTNGAGTYVYEAGDALATVSKRLPGDHPKTKTSGIAKSSGIMLARFHQAVTTLDHDGRGWLNKDRASSDSERLSDADPLTPVIRQVLRDNLRIFDAGLPVGIIHGDAYIDNLLFDGEVATAIFDFEEAERNVLLVDIVRTICSSVGIKDGRIDPELMRSIVEGYESIRPLTNDEKKYLPMTIRYVCAAAAVYFQLYAMPQREAFYIGLAQQTKDSDLPS